MPLDVLGDEGALGDDRVTVIAHVVEGTGGEAPSDALSLEIRFHRRVGEGDLMAAPVVGDVPGQDAAHEGFVAALGRVVLYPEFACSGFAHLVPAFPRPTAAARVSNLGPHAIPSKAKAGAASVGALDNPSFTTRPEIVGTFGVVASSHWVASQVGMAMLERGGNAFDAAVSAAFMLHVVEPHMNGLAGDSVILIEPAADAAPTVVCGQGVAPAAATIDALGRLGHRAIPATGLAAAVVPGSFDAWMLILRDHGTLELADVLAPAIGYAERGAPVCASLSQAIAGCRSQFTDEWPSSAAVYLPHGEVPQPGELLVLDGLAGTLKRIVAEAEGAPSREARIDRARSVFSQGFVAEAIDEFSRSEGGLLRGQDLAGWTASYESPLAVDFAGWQLFKAGPWTQGPVALQTLRLLDGAAARGGRQ